MSNFYLICTRHAGSKLLHQSNLWWAAAQIYLPLLITFRFFAVGTIGLVPVQITNMCAGVIRAVVHVRRREARWPPTPAADA